MLACALPRGNRLHESTILRGSRRIGNVCGYDRTAMQGFTRPGLAGPNAVQPGRGRLRQAGPQTGSRSRFLLACSVFSGHP